MRFFFHNIKIHVGTFRTKEEVLKARIDVEKKYYPDDEDSKDKKGKYRSWNLETARSTKSSM